MADNSLEKQEAVTYGSTAPRGFDEGLESSQIQLTPELFETYQKQIFEARPDIAAFLKAHGEESFYNYTKSHVRENKNSVIKERKKELHEVIVAEVARLLGTKIASGVRRQLKGNDSVSTIQHSVPLGHPYVLAATFQNALPYMGATHPNLQNVLVMANSLASFNNYSFPRADYLHVLETELLGQQFNFFGQTSEAASAMFHEPFTSIEIAEMEKRAQQLRQKGSITKKQLESIMYVLEEIYSSPHVLSQKSYIDQLTVLSYYLFKDLTKHYKKNIPVLVYLSQEKIALRLLSAYHMNKETVLGNLLFDPEYHKLFVKYFDGLNGAFNSKLDTGTHLFWAHPEGAKYRERLRFNGKKLESVESDYKVELTPEGLSHAIDHDELIPSTSLVFIVLSFYYGLFLGGGLAQVKNIANLKKAYANLLQDVHEKKEEAVLDDVNTDNLLISRPLLLFMKHKGKRIPLTGMDMLVYGRESKMEWEKVIEATKKVTVAEVMGRLYPFYYDQFVDKKDELLSQVTEADVEKYLSLQEKMPELFIFSEES